MGVAPMWAKAKSSARECTPIRAPRPARCAGNTPLAGDAPIAPVVLTRGGKTHGSHGGQARPRHWFKPRGHPYLQMA